MLPRLHVTNQYQTATKHIALCCGFVGLSFLAIVWLGFLLRTHASENALRHHKAAATSTKIKTNLAASYGKLPLSFEANHGQARDPVQFLSRGRGYALFLTGDEAVLELEKSSVVSGQSSVGTRLKPGVRTQEQGGKVGQRTTDNGQRTTANVLRMKLVGANAGAAVRGAEELPGKSNYFIGNDPKKWRTNVPTYAQVRYQNVYPGIDLVYHGSQSGQLEYDFVLAPGADPSAIALDVAAGSSGHGRRRNGVKPALQIGTNGNLVVRVNGTDEVRFEKPIVYQKNPDSSLITRHSSLVEGRYVLTASNQIRFVLGPYDHTQPLVIDPTVTYSTYLGGSGSGWGLGIAVDSSDSAYVTGYTGSTDFPTANPLQATNNGGSDVFLSKLNAAGNALVYSTYLGGSNADYGTGIAVDAAGNAYVTGFTQSADFPTANPLQSQCGACATGGNSAFVAKLNPTGSALVYSTYLGGGTNDYGLGIAADGAGDAYVTGTTCSADFPTANPLQGFGGGCANIEPPLSFFLSGYYAGDAFAAKLNPTGSALVYSTFLGGSNSDGGQGVTVDSAGNAYVTGFTYSVDFPTANPEQPFCGACGAGGSNAFVAKLNPTGSALVYSTYLGGSGHDFGNAIAVDAAGNADVTGSTGSNDFPTVNAVQPNNSLNVDEAFVTKLNPTGSALVYSTYLGPTVMTAERDFAGGDGIAVDSAGDAYVTGAANPFPLVNPLAETFDPICSNPGGVVFVAKVNATGAALVYSTCLGGDAGSQGYGIAVDAAGSAYLTGSTFPPFPTVNPLQANDGSPTGLPPGMTGFVAKISTTLSFSPASLTFSAQDVGTASPPQALSVINTSSASLTFSSVTVGGANPGDFATSDDTCTGATVTPNGTCAISVAFTPSATGNRSASLLFADTASDSPQALSLTGVATAPVAGVSAPSLTFGSQSLGTTSGSQSIILSNTGTSALNITSIVTSANFGQINNCAGGVAASDSCRIDVTFSPTAAGPLTGTLTITDNNNGVAGSKQTVTLSGTGTGPAMSLSAPGLSLGSEPVSTTSTAQMETVTNTGTANLTISAVAIGGANASDFGKSADTCTGATLTPSGACAVSVTFTPSAVGSRSASLEFTDNAFNSPQSVTLGGTGLGPAVRLSSSLLTFSAQLVGNGSTAQTVTLTSTGSASLSISSITASGDFSQTNTCGTSVSASANCTISVTFKPTAGGTRSGALSISDNALNSPQSVALSGTGQDFTVAAPSGSSTSASVSPGQPASYTLSVGSEGGLNQNVTFTCTGAPSEAKCTVSPNSAAPGTNVTVSVSTTAPSADSPGSRRLPPIPPFLPKQGILLMLAALLAGLTWTLQYRRYPGRSRRRPGFATLALGLLLTLVIAGCGGGGGANVTSNPGTPAGNYTLTVTGSTGSGSSALTHSVKLTLTVS